YPLKVYLLIRLKDRCRTGFHYNKTWVPAVLNP
ncbi:unnamed protein product, partial [marine sediment metagenome]